MKNHSSHLIGISKPINVMIVQLSVLKKSMMLVMVECCVSYIKFCSEIKEGQKSMYFGLAVSQTLEKVSSRAVFRLYLVLTKSTGAESGSQSQNNTTSN